MSFHTHELVRWLRAAEIEVRVLDAAGATIELPEITIDRVVYDNREADADTLFCAVPGENTHGARFVPDALRAGVRVCLVDGEAPRVEGVDGIVIEVDDARRALAVAARAWLDARDPVVVGITGSNGKTTTKDFLAAALSGDRRAVASPGNKNSRWGMPAAILSFSGDEDVLVLEMGASAPGEIGRLAAIARPWMGCVTNVGPAHIEFFGSVDEVARTKGQLLEALPENGVAVVNADDARRDEFTRRAGARNVLLFGESEDADVRIERAEDVETGVAVRIDGVDAVLPVFGAVNAWNAAAAVAMAQALGVRPEDALARIASAALSPHRSRRLDAAGRHVVDDAYNANPASMRAALQSLSRAQGGRRFAVLGEMAELGDDGVAQHRAVLGEALERGIDRVVVLGRSFAAASEGAEDPRIAAFDADATDDVAQLLVDETVAGDVVLLKGSRSAALERVLDAFVARAGRSAEGTI